ncbi:hypothetical protein B0A48_02905 [Cryoendolithus antarcticus]|uniref:Fungal N-terminal domain-containing protein n=1 Tax=Cryoendolithus antarcticus TaxID=1507870 RepID=A0A1V8TLT3_9PEZI|nr:hypothetical protein B0A48_02905 [Cryoendolithus antarcticus]
MGEVIGVAAGIIGLASSTLKIQNILRRVPAPACIDINALEVYGTMLRGLSNMHLQNTDTSSTFIVEDCLKLCGQHLFKLEQFAETYTGLKAKEPKAAAIQEIRDVFANFRDSVMLLRGVIMDSITHTMLQEQREAQKLLLELEYQLLSEAKSTTNINGNVHFGVPQESQSEADDDLNALRDDLQRLNMQVRSARNPFTTLIHMFHGDGQQATVSTVMAKLDTQSKMNWVRAEIVERLEAGHRIQDCTSPAVQGFGGEIVEASGTIELKWYETIVAKTRVTSFLVNPNNAPFDLILGWEWIKAEGPTAFAEPVLALRELNLTEGRETPQSTRTRTANLSQTSTGKCKLQFTPETTQMRLLFLPDVHKVPTSASSSDLDSPRPRARLPHECQPGMDPGLVAAASQASGLPPDLIEDVIHMKQNGIPVSQHPRAQEIKAAKGAIRTAMQGSGGGGGGGGIPQSPSMGGGGGMGMPPGMGGGGGGMGMPDMGMPGMGMPGMGMGGGGFMMGPGGMQCPDGTLMGPGGMSGPWGAMGPGFMMDGQAMRAMQAAQQMEQMRAMQAMQAMMAAQQGGGGQDDDDQGKDHGKAGGGGKK